MARPEAIRPTPPPPCDPVEDTPATFQRVLGCELDCINDSRPARDVLVRAHEDNLIGLAFSGGGIRSATFNLGILQALAQNGLLHKFDYLSTVSGGGYVGSWLAALTRRFTRTVPDSSFADVEKALVSEKCEPDKRNEPSFLHWLRLYSNYLTPNKGLTSGDTWAMLGTWLRNVILNQIILGLVFVGAFLLCQAAVLWMNRTADYYDVGWGFLAAGGVVLFFAAVSMAINVVEQSPSRKILETPFQRVKVTVTVMLPFVAACVLINCGLWQELGLAQEPTAKWAMAGAAFYFVVWGSVALLGVRRRLQGAKPMISLPTLLVSSPLAGAAGACLLKAYSLLLNHLPDWTSTNWVVVVFGSGIVMLVTLLAGALHLGLVGRGCMDVVREWWARLGGYLMLMTIGWLALAGTCIFAPLLLRGLLLALGGLGSISAGLLWVLHNYLGLKAASSATTSGNAANAVKAAASADMKPGAEQKGWAAGVTEALKSPRVKEVLAKVAPYVFAVGLVLLLGAVVQFAVGLFYDRPDTQEFWRLGSGLTWYALCEDYWAILGQGAPGALAGLSVGLFVAALFLSWRVDINDFSLHHFYRNRLVRCYLGASNPHRKPEPFTGFDPADDLPLGELAQSYPGPYPILNASLNITSGEELGYATRRAKSFVFTPAYCGYEYSPPGEGPQQFTRADGYEPSFSKTALGRSAHTRTKFGSEGGISLGTAMAISGAAASPNMGYYTSPATAFFMTLFDVRLGWWMGNPLYPERWKSAGPGLGMGYLFSELLAHSDQKKGYVYLSDGGHFENLAVYELIRRRCRLIVACDCDSDPHYEFENLLSLIEKARMDFSARIEINCAPLKARQGERESESNYAVGTIHYDPWNDSDVGTLIFIKSSMPTRAATIAATGAATTTQRSLPDDVWRYRELNPTFPHQSTADQWFDEWQFESYRALGEYIGGQAAKAIADAVEATLARPATTRAA
jgi:patatin-like phospholipase